MTKKIIALILSILILTTLAIPVFAVSIPRPKENRCVYDGASVLTKETSQFINNVNLSLENSQIGAEIGVVTLDKLPSGYDSEEYSYEVFNKWGIGNRETDNGILLLLVPSQGKCWLSVGDGLNNYLTSYDLENIMTDKFYSDFDNGLFDRAVKNTVRQLVSELEFIYDVEIYDVGNTSTYSNRQYGQSNNGFDFDILIVIGILVFVIVISGTFTKGGRRYHGTSRPYYGGRPHHHHGPTYYGGFNNHNHRGGGFGGGGFGGGSFGGFGGGSSSGGGAGRA